VRRMEYARMEGSSVLTRRVHPWSPKAKTPHEQESP
jgi:hypothetical protein